MSDVYSDQRPHFARRPLLAAVGGAVYSSPADPAAHLTQIAELPSPPGPSSAATDALHRVRPVAVFLPVVAIPERRC